MTKIQALARCARWTRAIVSELTLCETEEGLRDYLTTHGFRRREWRADGAAPVRVEWEAEILGVEVSFDTFYGCVRITDYNGDALVARRPLPEEIRQLLTKIN